MERKLLLDSYLGENQSMLQRVVSFIEAQDPPVAYEYQYSIKMGERPYYADLFLPNGFLGKRIIGPTIVELKNRLGADTLLRYYERFLFLKDNNGVGIQNFVLIYNDKNDFSDAVLRKFYEFRKEGFFVYSVSGFCRRKVGTKEIPAYPEPRYFHVLSEDEKQKRIIEKAHFAFNMGHCTLFLGAGVSCSVNVPKWEVFLSELLNRSSNVYIKRRDYQDVNESCDHSSIISGRYIKNGFDTDEDFENEMKAILYEKNPIPDSKLFKTIVAMIQSTKPDGGYRVDQVITYNYDDLLEEALRSVKRPCHSIFNRTIYTGSFFPVYHVHGMIPKSPLVGSTPVLGESEYHQLYKETFHWSNVVQLHALSRNTCFFIGLSMNDPNLRRLLDISRNGVGLDENIESLDPIHYAIMEKRPLKKGNPDYDKDNEHLSNIEGMMAQLGINIIWYDNQDESHSEVPTILERIVMG